VSGLRTVLGTAAFFIVGDICTTDSNQNHSQRPCGLVGLARNDTTFWQGAGQAQALPVNSMTDFLSSFDPMALGG
jgi:hypothetical protein